MKIFLYVRVHIKIIPWTFCILNPKNSQHSSGYKVPPEKIQSDLKSQFPPEITLLKSQQNFQPHLKFPDHSHLACMLQKVIKMTGVKLIVGRRLLIGIYWYQSTNRRFIHFHKGGLTISYCETKINTFLEFISNITYTFRELLPNNTRFSRHQSILTFSESYWQTIVHNFLEFISSNNDILREFLSN